MHHYVTESTQLFIDLANFVQYPGGIVFQYNLTCIQTLACALPY